MVLTAESEELLDAMVKQGVQTSLQVARSANGVRGLYTTEAVPKGTLIMSCPGRTTLTMPRTDSAYAAPFLLREVLYHRRQQQVNQQQPQQHQATAPEKQNPAADSAATTNGAPDSAPAHPSHCVICGARIWKSSMPSEFIASLPHPDEVITGYSWPEEAIRLLACPDLETVVHIMKRRAERVYRTGLIEGSALRESCTGALFPLTLAEAELQANGLCPQCTTHTPAGHQNRSRAGGTAQHNTSNRPALQHAASSTFTTGELHKLVTGTVTYSDITEQNLDEAHIDANGVPTHARSSRIASTNGTACVGIAHNDVPGIAPVDQVNSADSALAGQAASASLLVLDGLSLATLADVEWAATLVCSRTFQSSTPMTMVMVPVLDMVNHQEYDANASVESASESGDPIIDDIELDDDENKEAQAPHHSDNGNAHVLPLAAALESMHLLQAEDRNPKSGNDEDLKEKEADAAVVAASQHVPQEWAPRFKRLNVMHSTRALCKDEEVTFSYHPGFRDDEVLIYYGFMVRDAPAYLCAVDHHLAAARLMALSTAAGSDMYDDGGGLMIDPLDGPWRPQGSVFKGMGKAVQIELDRLGCHLDDHNQRCSELLKNTQLMDKARAACQARGVPWLVDLCADFRRRRGKSLQLEIQRLWRR